MATLNVNEILRVGFLINPLAGIGGPAGLKGSDSDFIHDAGVSGELNLRAIQRAQTFFSCLQGQEKRLHFITAQAQMGQALLDPTDFNFTVLDNAVPEETFAEHTRANVKAMLAEKIDILMFVGGDGTARDVCSVIEIHGPTLPVLGIPSGVKMHSGVFAINPHGAAEVLKKIVEGDLIKIESQEVRDIDEVAFRESVVKSRYYGELQVPFDDQFVQAVKQGGGEPDELALVDIAEEIRQRIDEMPDGLFVFAPGSTTQFIQQELGYDNTLLGVDVVSAGETIARDVSAANLEALLAEHNGPARLIVTAIGGQGHIIGRGNQQLSPAVLKHIGRDNVWVVSTSRKLHALNTRPLLLDTNDSELDNAWAGLIPVITGYQQQILYRVAC